MRTFLTGLAGAVFMALATSAAWAQVQEDPPQPVESPKAPPPKVQETPTPVPTPVPSPTAEPSPAPSPIPSAVPSPVPSPTAVPTPEKQPKLQEAPDQEAPRVDPMLPPVRRRGAADAGTFLDTDGCELALRLAFISFSKDFDADSQIGGSLLIRLPSPVISRGLFDMEKDDVGLFAEFTISSIDRNDIPSSQDPKGSLYFVTFGLDYALLSDETTDLRFQAAIQYASFGGVTATDDGMGGLFGLLGDWKVADGVAIALSPQISVGGSGASILFVHLGVQIEF